MISNKKSVSPVIATMLLVLVAVLAALALMNWFSEFQSEQTAEIDSAVGNLNTVSIKEVINISGKTKVLFSNTGSSQVNIEKIQILKSDRTEACKKETATPISSSSTSEIEISSCPQLSGNKITVRLTIGGDIKDLVSLVE